LNDETVEQAIRHHERWLAEHEKWLLSTLCRRSSREARGGVSTGSTLRDYPVLFIPNATPATVIWSRRRSLRLPGARARFRRQSLRKRICK